MLNKVLFHRFPLLKSWITRVQYELISALDRDRNVIFMNFGYAPHEYEPVSLAMEDEKHRYPLQLYHHVARHIAWENTDVLEISSGRGGGAHFIMRHFKPRSYTGVDFSSRAIEFCRTHYNLDGLKFHHGNAEALTFPDNSFDVVVNVEASLYYPNIDRFFEHVRRVLKPGGYFLYTDLRYEEKVPAWHDQLKSLGLKIIREEDITENVLRATELDRERRISLINKYAPVMLRRSFLHFAGVSPDQPETPPHLENRRYWYFVLQKTPPG